MSKQRHDADSETVTRDRSTTRYPKSFRVILLNDNYTTMDFVVAILEGVFRKSPAEAVQIMLRVHSSGQGVAGIFPRQIAEAKMNMVHEKAREAGFPLRCTMEEA